MGERGVEPHDLGERTPQSQAHDFCKAFAKPFKFQLMLFDSSNHALLSALWKSYAVGFLQESCRHVQGTCCHVQ